MSRRVLTEEDICDGLEAFATQGDLDPVGVEHYLLDDRAHEALLLTREEVVPDVVQRAELCDEIFDPCGGVVLFGDIEDPTLLIVPLGVGKDVVVAQIVGVVMAVPGVYSVVVEAPAADVVIDPNQFPEQGLVTINMEAPSDE